MIVLFYLGIFIFIGLAILLCTTILLQESKSLGFGASFGGDAGTSMFGTSTAAVLKKITAWFIVIFFVLCLFFSFFAGRISSGPQIEQITIEGNGL